MVDKWIPPDLKKGALSRQLGIPEVENIPTPLLKKIMDAKLGSTITNPTKIGNERYHVTRLMKMRANFALNMRR
ncbi:MAG: hypothetical protein NT074_00870 [Methanomicrobiales archaeon]|nr:hypothetical protein [Methanomicrobiales archaeon]